MLCFHDGNLPKESIVLYEHKVKNSILTTSDFILLGSCASFSAVGAIEGIVAIVTGKLLDLSAQELVDCVGNGCTGVYVYEALQWVFNNKGVALDSKYPYTGVVAPCKASTVI